MSEINNQQVATLKTVIAKELDRLIHQLNDEMNPELRASFSDLSGEVADSDDDAVADRMVDLDNAIIGLHLQKVDDLHAALERIQAGKYGLCKDCGKAISFERLHAYPTAKRCFQCQITYEKTTSDN